MTVAELRLALADYPPDAEVEVLCGAESLPYVCGVASMAEALEDARRIGAPPASLRSLQAMLAISDPGTVFLLVCYYA